MYDLFAMIRFEAAGISPPTASILWSESVAAAGLELKAHPHVLRRTCGYDTRAIVPDNYRRRAAC
jgi:hypothetical protein